MLRKAVALIAVLAVAGLTAGCDTGSKSSKPTNATTTNVTPPPPLKPGEAAAQIGIKWNWNLKPPQNFAREIGWGDTFYEVEWCGPQGRSNGNRIPALERLIPLANQMGYRMMIKIRVGGCNGGAEALDPAEGTRKSPSTYPDDPAAYQTFVRNLVTRYKTFGVTTWAIENEVDAGNFWSGTGQQYIDTVKLGVAAIKDVEPNATILDAGISSTGYGVTLAGDLLDAGKDQEALALYKEWYGRRASVGNSRFPAVETIDDLRKVLNDQRTVKVRQMVKANFEVVNTAGVTAYQLHFYENPDLLPVLLNYIDTHMTTKLPIQAWEVGTAWPGPGYTEAAHAADTARLLGTLLARHISPVVYLPLAFTPGSGKTEVFRGLVSPDGNPLPSGQVFAKFAGALRKSSEVVPLTVGTGSGVLIVGPEKSFAAVWPVPGGTPLKVAGKGVLAAETPTSTVAPGADATGPVLIDLSATDQAKALTELSSALGTTASAS